MKMKKRKEAVCSTWRFL